MAFDDGPSFIDLFSGCGGLSNGFSQAGFVGVAAVDNWDDALETHSLNHPSMSSISMDLGSKSSIASLKAFRGIDVIVGGPPCQGFSISGKRNPLDERNDLYKGFLEAVRILKPKFFLMENVPNLMGMQKGSIYNQIVVDFEQIGYSTKSSILLASDFGVPQNRKRFFMVGQPKSHIDNSFIFPETQFLVDQKITCLEAISDLPKNTLKNGSRYPSGPKSDYQTEMRKESDEVWNHEITQHTEKTKSIIALVPDGGNYKDLPKSLQQTRKVNIAWTRLNSQKPSLTVDTGHRHHFHYKWNRVPTVREAARLQSFSDNFIFSGTRTSQMRQVGNAVPPLLAKALATKIIEVI